MRVKLFIAVSGLLTLPAYAAELEVSVEIPKLNVAEYHRPYVAIWLEGADQKVASSIIAGKYPSIGASAVASEPPASLPRGTYRP